MAVLLRIIMFWSHFIPPGLIQFVQEAGATGKGNV